MKKLSLVLVVLALFVGNIFVTNKSINAAKPSDFGLKEGDVISATGDPDVYIVNDFGYKRLFVNPQIFNLYGHLGWDKIKKVSPAIRDAFITSGLFRNCEATRTTGEKVYGLDVINEDVANLRWINTTGAQAVADDANFFQKVFCINTKETKLYGTGSQYSSVRDIPKYARSGSSTQTPTLTSATLHIDLVAPDRILAGTPYTVVIKGSGFNKNAKVDFGAGNIQIGYAITSDFLISVLVPSGLPSLTYNLSITNPDGQIAILKDALTVQGAPPATNTELSDTEIFSKVAPSTALIFTGNFTGAGTGIVLSSDGYILTNEHVIKNYTSVDVYLNDDGYFVKPYKHYIGTVLGKDSVNDLAVVKISASGLRPIEVGNSSNSSLPVGSPVYALGFPLIFDVGASSVKLLSGKIVGTSGEFLQTDANIQAGNSGGPMVNSKGELVGINNWCLGTKDFCQQGFGFAISINHANPLIPGLKAGVSSTPTPAPIPSATPTPTPAPTPTLTPTPIPGTISVSQSADNPAKDAKYWGQSNTPFSKFRLTSTGEGKYIEKITIAASDPDEVANAATNVKDVILTYKNKAGSTITTTNSFGNSASANFGWASIDSNRPYVPQNGSLDIAVNANLKTKDEGAVQNVQFSLDLVNRYNGSISNGFRSVGENTGTVISGSGISNVTANKHIVYRVYPKIEQVALSSPYSMIGTPTVFKFSITSMGLATANLRFDPTNSIKFEIVSSGSSEINTTTKTTFSTLDESGTIVDTGELIDDFNPSINAPLITDFGSQTIEIAGGETRTFSIRLNNPTQHYANAGTTGRAADYFQVTLLDNAAGLINWTSDDTSVSSVSGVLRSLPLYGPTFQR